MNTFDQANSPRIIDIDALNQRFQGRQDFINRLLTLALNEHGDAPVQLETIIQQKDINQLRTFAHTIKGMAANIMAHQLKSISQTVEMKAREHDESVFDLANNMKKELTSFVTELKSLLEK